jgi:hypothetical protein
MNIPFLALDGIGSTHPEYRANFGRWEKCREVIAGEDVIKLEGTEYLPKPSGMSDDEYLSYKDRAAFYELTARARDAMIGLVAKKKPAFRAPESVAKLAEDITYDGTDLDSFAFSTLAEVVDVGRCGVLVDYPKTDTIGLSMSDVEEDGLRPYAVLYFAEDILDWRRGRINNRKKLTYLKLRESFEEPMPDSPYNTEAKYRLRVYRIVDGKCVYEIYGTDSEGEWAKLPEEMGVLYRNGRVVRDIPFEFFGPLDNSPDVQKPPLLAMANMNIHHYQASADRNHALHYCDLPTPIIRGAFIGLDGEQPDSIRLGPTSAIHLQADGDAKFLEMEGNGVNPTKELMQEYVSAMGMLGNKIIAIDKSGTEAAETASIHRAGEQAILAAMARNVSHGLTEVLELMAEYTGEDSEEIDYQLSTDYLPYAMDSQTLIALIGAVSAGKMSDEEFFEALVAGEMVRPDKTYNQHKEELARMPKPASITPDSGGTFGLADKGIADARAPNTKVAGTAVIDGQAQQSVDKGTK